MRNRSSHPAEHHPSFRAVIAAASPVAELARVTADAELVGRLAIACGDLVSGFTAPPGSTTRSAAHHRAWVTVRELDRSVRALAIGRRAPARLLSRVQRAIDRADVMIGALPGVVVGH